MGVLYINLKHAEGYGQLKRCLLYMVARCHSDIPPTKLTLNLHCICVFFITYLFIYSYSQELSDVCLLEKILGLSLLISLHC